MKFRSYYFILTNSKSRKAEVRGQDTVTEWQHFPNTRICFFQPSNQISGSKYPDHSNQTTKSESDSSNQLQSCLRGLILVGTFLRCSKAWRQTELHWEQNYFNLNPNVW